MPIPDYEVKSSRATIVRWASALWGLGWFRLLALALLTLAGWWAVVHN